MLQIGYTHTACVTQVRAHTHSNETVIRFFFFLQSTLSIQSKPDSSMGSHKVSPVCIADMHTLRDRWACKDPFGSELGGFFLPIVSVNVTTLGYLELTFQKAKLSYFFCSVSLKNLVAFGHLKQVLRLCPISPCNYWTVTEHKMC